MTTIFIDTNKRVIVADTRMTIRSGNNRSYGELNKVFDSVCGKFHIAGAGDVLLIHNYIRNVLKVEVNSNVTKGCTSSRGDSCNILITNKYNKQVKVVTLTKKRLYIKCEDSYMTDDFVTAGSGGEVVCKLWYKVTNPLKVVHYASIKDKYTNDKVSVTFY